MKTILQTALLRAVLSTLLIPDIPSAAARDLSEAEVRAAVETWVRHVTADARSDAVIERMEPCLIDGQTSAYVAQLAGGGYCLCGANDLLLPVYLYNPAGRFDPALADLRSVLDEIGARLTSMRDLAQPAALAPATRTLIVDRAAYWADLIAGRVPPNPQAAKTQPSGGPDLLELPFTPAWHQGSPYNDRCPTLVPDQDSTRVVAGCVPIAAGQIMYYWKWPPNGVGSRSDGSYPRRYSADWIEEPLAINPNVPTNWADGLGQGRILEWTGTSGGKLRMRGYWDVSMGDGACGISSDSAYRAAVWALYNRLADAQDKLWVNFGINSYSWNLLQNDHTDPPDTADAEAAKLCFHLGVAIGSRYGVWTTSSGWLVDALKQHFRYDSDALAEWKQADSTAKITEDLQWFRPVALGGCGHAWVAYGYNKATDPNRQFLMNMGWGPENSRVWYTFDRGATNIWCPVENHETRIAPTNIVRFVGATDGGDGSPDNPHRNIEEALTSVPDGGTLVFKAGSVNTFSSAALTISRPLTFKGVEATIRKP